MPEHPGRLRFSEEFSSFIWETIKVVVISLVIIVPIRYYLIQPFFVKGSSMVPNFIDKDYVLVDKLHYRLDQPTRGDVIVFRYPLDQREYFIKRIIALPGETIDIQNDKVTIYNAQRPEGFVLNEYYLSPDQETTGTVRMKLDDNEYFVMGDNRLHSSDSRRWGLVNRTLISGKAWLRLWPFDKVQFIPDAKYAQPISVN